MEDCESRWDDEGKESSLLLLHHHFIWQTHHASESLKHKCFFVSIASRTNQLYSFLALRGNQKYWNCQRCLFHAVMRSEMRQIFVALIFWWISANKAIWFSRELEHEFSLWNVETDAGILYIPGEKRACSWCLEAERQCKFLVNVLSSTDTNHTFCKKIEDVNPCIMHDENYMGETFLDDLLGGFSRCEDHASRWSFKNGMKHSSTQVCLEPLRLHHSGCCLQT